MMDENIDDINNLEDKQIKRNNGSNFFHKIAFLGLDNKRKEKVAGEIIEEGNFGKVYRSQLVLSGIICTLGLLINSVPVIIGAMLIAPILLPIKTLAFAITTGNRHMYRSGLKFIILSIIIGIATAALVTYLTPLAKLTPEITSRISPTLIDLFIALASGVIAFLSLGYKKLRENLAGVAMATALIPPLCVTGIGLIFNNIEIAQGSMLLFLTNIIAIILVGVIIFFAFGFFATNNKGQKRSFSTIFITLIIIVAISIPLSNSMKSIANDMQITKTIEQTTEDFFQALNEEITIEDSKYQNLETNKIRISTSIEVPDTMTITQEHKNDLSKILAASTEKSVELDLNIVTLSSVHIEQEVEATQEEVVQDMVTKKIKEYTGVIIIEIKIAHYDDTQLLYINLFSETPQNQEKIHEEMQNIAKTTLGDNAIATILRHKNGETKQENLSRNTKIVTERKYTNAIRDFLKQNLPKTYLETVKFTEPQGTENTILMTIELSSSLSRTELETNIENLKESMENTFEENYQIYIKTNFFSELNFK